MLSWHDQKNLEWYFAQYAFERSTFGATLARQDARFRDSEGKVVGRAEGWNWNPAPNKEGAEAPNPQMFVKEDTGGTLNEPDDEDLTRHATVSRRLMLVSRISHMAHAVLGAYFGNEGNRWQGFTNGRLWALAPLTLEGQAILARIKLTPDVRPAEALAKRLHGKEGPIRVQSERLLASAEDVWKSTAPKRQDRREDARNWRRDLLARNGLVPGC